jgi:cytochrome c-type biogenesis protein CcmF
MIPEFGLIALIMAFVLSLLHCVVPAGRWCQIATQELANVSLTLVFAQCFLVTLSFVTLTWAFVHDDFSVHYVAQHSNTLLPLYYKIGAVWGGHEGSLLLWALILSIWSLAIGVASREIPSVVRLTVGVVLNIILLGFLGMILGTSNPFERLLPEIPIEGADLNPILQDITFILHPPILYIGYVGLAIPFAFAIAECLHKTHLASHQWVSWVRPWTLLAVGALSLGITLGSWWAYYELGWGGWWFWDPVENASLMPWLVGCAYVHMLWVSRDTPRYHAWRTVLALVAFLLSLLGTFLTRSGIMSTVHAFTSDQSRGVYLLSFLSIATVAAAFLYAMKLKHWEEGPTVPPFSKVGLMFLGSILLVVSTFSILLGTLYPLVIDTFKGETLSIGSPYFNTVITPIWGLCLLLMAMAPRLQFPRLQILLMGLPVMVLMGACYWHPAFSWGATLGVGVAGWLIVTTLAQLRSVLKSRGRWGYWIAHMGVAVTAMGVVLSVSLETEKSLTLQPGQTAVVGDYTLVMNTLVVVNGANYEGIRAYFDVKRHGRPVTVLTPEKRYYKARDLVTTESSLGRYRWTDFTLALGEPLGDDRWSLRFYTKPFVRFIWLGGVMMALGMLSKFVTLRRKMPPLPCAITTIA